MHRKKNNRKTNKDLKSLCKLNMRLPIRLRKIDGNAVNYNRMDKFNQMCLWRERKKKHTKLGFWIEYHFDCMCLFLFKSNLTVFPFAPLNIFFFFFVYFFLGNNFDFEIDRFNCYLEIVWFFDTWTLKLLINCSVVESH